MKMKKLLLSNYGKLAITNFNVISAKTIYTLRFARLR